MNTELMEQSLLAFDINGGFEPNLRIFSQARFAQALSPNRKMILFPSVGTGKIFRAILT